MCANWECKYSMKWERSTVLWPERRWCRIWRCWWNTIWSTNGRRHVTETSLCTPNCSADRTQSAVDKPSVRATEIPRTARLRSRWWRSMEWQYYSRRESWSRIEVGHFSRREGEDQAMRQDAQLGNHAVLRLVLCKIASFWALSSLQFCLFTLSLL